MENPDRVLYFDGGGYSLITGSLPNVDKILKMVFPTMTGAYWFMTAFIGLMLLTPFLNQFAQNANERHYRYLIVVLVLLLVVPPKNTWSSDLIWFCMVYLTAGYLRLYGTRYLNTQVRRAVVAIGCFATMWLTSIAISLASLNMPALSPQINYFSFRQNSPFMYLGSVAIFLLVLNMRPWSNLMVNQASKHVLPCYLIQSSPFFSGILWEFVDALVPKKGIYPIAFFLTICVLTVCFMLIDAVLVSLVGMVGQAGRKIVRFRH